MAGFVRPCFQGENTPVKALQKAPVRTGALGFVKRLPRRKARGHGAPQLAAERSRGVMTRTATRRLRRSSASVSISNSPSP